MRSFLVLLAALLATLPARAEDPRDPVEARPAGADADAWQLYDQAFSAAVAGNDAEALSLVSQLKQRFSGSGAALLGSELGRFLESKGKGAVVPQDPSVRLFVPQKLAPPVPVAPPPKKPQSLASYLRDEKPTSFARGELTFWQTINGVGLGLDTCFILGCDDDRAFIVSAMLGGGIGAAGALYFTADGITAGHALAVDSGSAWGFWNGMALSRIVDLDSKGTAGIAASAQIGGTLLGHLAWTAFPVGAGDVSLANSGGIWAGVLTLWADFIIGGSQSEKAFFASLLAGSDLGLIGGGFLSRLVPMSRGRTFILDAGGLLGMLLGMGIEVLITGNGGSNGAFGAAAISGIVAGLGTAGYLTRDWDLAELPDVKLGLVPVPGGGGMVTAMLVR